MASYDQNGKLDINKLKTELQKIQEKIEITDTNGDFSVFVTIDGYIFEIDDKGNVVAIRENQGGGETPNPPVEEILAKDVLKINPDSEDAASKSPYVQYNGLDCRVLYNDETHGLQLITAESVEEVTLGYGDETAIGLDLSYNGKATLTDNFKKAVVSYNNAVDKLNNKAKSYMDTKGIATDARCIGSVPTLNGNSEFQGDTSEMWLGTYDYLTVYSWNNIFKTVDTNYSEDVTQLNSLGLNVSSGYTWLASRDVRSYSDYTAFDLRYVDASGVINGDYFFMVRSGDPNAYRSPFRGFRPVFLLPFNYVISKGDGTNKYPYIIE